MPSAYSNNSKPAFNAALHWFAVVVALATFGLIAIGGLVTSRGAGMSVPDWPNSYGYNMFLFPPSKWVGGILYEHTHRLWASTVGVLVIALARWLGGYTVRRPLAIVGALEMAAGIAILSMRPDLKATGGFLSGIGGLVLLTAAIWVRNQPAQDPLPQLGWFALVLVQLQGLLGGLRVVLFKDQIGIFHATLAQVFLVLTCVIALLTSRWWMRFSNQKSVVSGQPVSPVAISIPRSLRRLAITTTVLILFQLILGAIMRHQHAGLAIPDFPLAYGRLWPATSPEAVTFYNQQRMEVTGFNPITEFQIQLQMVHRLVAVLVLMCVATTAWKTGRIAGQGSNIVRWLGWSWLGLILIQIGLGAATILSDKAADIATAHVMAGALSLAVGAVMCIVSMSHHHVLDEASALPCSAHEESPLGAGAATQSL